MGCGHGRCTTGDAPHAWTVVNKGGEGYEVGLGVSGGNTSRVAGIDLNVLPLLSSPRVLAALPGVSALARLWSPMDAEEGAHTLHRTRGSPANN